jgi:hypothetical protein
MHIKCALSEDDILKWTTYITAIPCRLHLHVVIYQYFETGECVYHFPVCSDKSTQVILKPYFQNIVMLLSEWKGQGVTCPLEPGILHGWSLDIT